MSLDDLTCEVCGMRYGDVDLYHQHVEQAHAPETRLDDDRLSSGGHDPREGSRGV